MRIEHIAHICHEANRAYCEAMGDLRHVEWHAASGPQRDSVVAGVMEVVHNPAVTPEQLHERWVENKRLQGWTWGPEKDSMKKQHPCLVPYDQLPPRQQMKDHLFQAIVRTFIHVPE